MVWIIHDDRGVVTGFAIIPICTMLRMNLKSHEIAGIFCISESGVEFHRQNIRRKLKLRKEEKLPIVLGAM